jgi:hypothetical protein
MATMKVGKIPGGVRDIEVEEGMTLSEAIEAADFSADDYDVRLDGSQTTDLSQPVEAGQMVMLAPAVRGN